MKSVFQESYKHTICIGLHIVLISFSAIKPVRSAKTFFLKGHIGPFVVLQFIDFDKFVVCAFYKTKTETLSNFYQELFLNLHSKLKAFYISVHMSVRNML